MTESQFPGTNHWKRKILSKDGIAIVLHDHRDTNAIKGAVTLENDVISRANVADCEFSALLAVPAPNPATNPERAVVHIIGNRSGFLAAAFPGADSYQAIILQATTQDSGLGDDHEPAEKVVWLSMQSRESYKKADKWLPQFLRLSFEDAVKIAKAKDRGTLDPRIQEDYAKLLDITHPGDPTASLAFRLLCEAWTEVNVNQNRKLSGLPITAPKDLTGWLAPFAPDGNDDAAKIASVVSKTGDADKTKVRNVLDAANDDPKEQVLAFLGLTQAPTARPQGGAQ